VRVGVRASLDALRQAYRRGVLDLSAAQGLMMALGFVQNMILARLLGASGIGHLAIVYSTMSIAALLGTAGVTTSIARFGAMEREEGRAWSVLARGAWLVAGVSVVVAAGVALFARSPYWAFDPVAAEWLPFVLIALPTQALASCTWAYMQARERMRDRALFELFFRLCVVVSVVTGSWLGGFAGAMTAYVVGHVLGAALSGARTLALQPASKQPSSVPARELLRFGSWGLATNLLGMVLTTADVLFLSAFGGDPVAVGVYSLAKLFDQVVGVPRSAYLDARFPEMARRSGDPSDLRALRRRMRAHLVLLAVGPGVAVAAIAPFLLPRVFGAEFAGSVLPLWILLVGQAAAALGSAQGRSLLAAGWVEGNFQASIVAAAWCLAANAALVPTYGAVGAAIATASTHACFAIVVSILCRRHERSRLEAA
jgi:O-antigen/teichoic acid export membrane protein